ncbi:MAG: group I intron-associated PD-(D/E)XK endonuclease [Bacteroidia bacterium]
MFIKSSYKDASEQGIAGLTIAINWFSNNGYFVSLPIADVRPYDIIAERGNRLYKIQVKTTIVKHEFGSNNTKRLYYKISSKKYKKNDFHYYFIATPEENYLIPKKQVPETSGMKRLYLTSKYEKYQVK